MARSLTSANAIIMLTVPGLFSTPQQLQGFGADNIYDMGSRVLAETAMGVDGVLSAGYVNNPVEQTFTLQADSLSNDLFETWAQTSQQQNGIFRCNGSTTLLATGKTYISTNGVFVSFPPAPTAGKRLMERKYVIQWQSVVANPT